MLFLLATEHIGLLPVLKPFLEKRAAALLVSKAVY
jgi:hypothetical protein